MNRSFNRLWLMAVTLMFGLVSTNLLAKGGFIELDGVFDEFSNEITNHWTPLPAGLRLVYLEEDDDECIVGVVDVIPTAQQWVTSVKGVSIREIHDQEFIDNVGDCDGDTADMDEWELLETTMDWYAQDVDGNVWYFGEYSIAFDHDECDRMVTLEDTDPPFYMEIEDGCLDGSWEAGKDVAGTGVDPEEVLEGIIMLIEPEKGQFYFQEYYEDEAEDMGKVLNFKDVETFLDEEVQEGCVVIKEWVPLEPGEVEHKYFCSGKGLVLVAGVAGGKTLFTELVEVVDP